MKTGAASYCGAWAAYRGVMKWRRKQCFIVRLLWSTAAPYEAARCAMKRTCGVWSEAWRLHIFLPWNQGKKMVDLVSLIRKILPSSNGCKLIKNGYRFVKLRKYLYFQHFWKQRKFFCLTKTTSIPKQLQNVPKKDGNLRLFPLRFKYTPFYAKYKVD